MHKKTKYKKFRNNRLKKLELKAHKLKFGLFGLKAKESGVINLAQIASAKQSILKKIKKKGKIWVRIFTDLIITSKFTGSRMGKGQGFISNWVVKINCGTILFEICCTNHTNTLSALKIAGSKLPIKTKITTLKRDKL